MDALHGMRAAVLDPVMNEKSPMPGFSVAQSAALKKKLRSLRWKPEAVMRETMLIQQLRELVLIGGQ
jgi:hypothetical protein